MGNPYGTVAYTNCNPLNLRPLPNGEMWNGQTGVYFNLCKFVSQEKGVRAAVINMRSIVRMGRTTLKQVIYTWAPPPASGLKGVAGTIANGEDQNDSDAYLSHVCNSSGLSPTYDLSWLATSSGSSEQHVDELMRIVRGMNEVEAGGASVTEEEIVRGIDDALQIPVGFRRTDTGNIVQENVNTSHVIKAADRGQVNTMIGVASGVGIPAISAMSGANPIVVAMILGFVLVVGAAYFIYKLQAIKNDRRDLEKKEIV